MKKNVLWNIVFAFMLVVLLFCEAIAFITILRMDMLPQLYLGILAGVLAVFALVIALLMFLPSRGSGKVKRIIACVLTLITVCGCAAIITVATDVMETIEASTLADEDLQLATREVYVRKDDAAQELSDLATYTVGYLKNYDDVCSLQVLDVIASENEAPVATAAYTNVFTMMNALLENRIDAMVLSRGHLSVFDDLALFGDDQLDMEEETFLAEDESVEDAPAEGEDDVPRYFSSKMRILKAVPVIEPVEQLEELPMYEQEETEETTEPTVTEETEPTGEEDSFVNLKPFVVYVSGSDGRTALLKSSRSDVNILAAVNPMTKQVLLVNSPRDFYIKTSVSGGAKDKLTHCGIYGIDCSMKTLAKLYDQDVKYYAQINFSGFRKLINAMGGITVYSEKAFTAMKRTEIKKGWNDLTGGQALDFARERKVHIDGDNARGRNQMQVIKAVIKKATSVTTIISNYGSIMDSLEGMVAMNIPDELISDMVKMQLSDMAQWNVVTYAATGYYDGAICYSMPGTKLSVVQPYQSSIKKATTMMDMVLAGEILTEEVVAGITD